MSPYERKKSQLLPCQPVVSNIHFTGKKTARRDLTAKQIHFVGKKQAMLDESNALWCYPIIHKKTCCPRSKKKTRLKYDLPKRKRDLISLMPCDCIFLMNFCISINMNIASSPNHTKRNTKNDVNSKPTFDNGSKFDITDYEKRAEKTKLILPREAK